MVRETWSDFWMMPAVEFGAGQSEGPDSETPWTLGGQSAADLAEREVAIEKGMYRRRAVGDRVRHDDGHLNFRLQAAGPRDRYR